MHLGDALLVCIGALAMLYRLLTGAEVLTRRAWRAVVRRLLRL